jgi:TonB family protein
MRSETPTEHLFCIFPEKRPPWKHFALSMSSQSVMIFASLAIAALHPKLLVPAHSRIHVVKLAHAPVALSLTKSPEPLSRSRETPSVTPQIDPIVVRLKSPVLTRNQETPLAPKIQLASRVVPLPPTAPVIPKQLVKTSVFSTGKTESQTSAAYAETVIVKTGSFGDPNGIAAKAGRDNPVTIANLGAFDFPAGVGLNSSIGINQGQRGSVNSAGFSTETISTNHPIHASTGAIAQAGFGDAEVTTASQKTKQTEVSKTLPAEIVSKPTPIYTEEARKLHIEGEVLLEVLFESSGNVQVVRVVRGLGHGLDEAAIQAAEQIHFKPALRDGQPADSRGVLHITFQLA